MISDPVSRCIKLTKDGSKVFIALNSRQELIDNRRIELQNDEAFDVLQLYSTKPCVLICVDRTAKKMIECDNIQTLLHSNNPNDTITAMDISNDGTQIAIGNVIQNPLCFHLFFCCFCVWCNIFWYL